MNYKLWRVTSPRYQKVWVEVRALDEEHARRRAAERGSAWEYPECTVEEVRG